ncbi:MAG: 1,4-alpha-glucan branching enzyme, partial [Chloroflexota bacterium]
MPQKISSTLAPEAVDAIIGGYHGDPFAVLGPHPVDGGTAVRAMQPQAAEISLKLSAPQKKTVKMKRLHDSGFFEAIVKGVEGPLTYQLAITTHDGQQYTSHDAYRFPSMLSDFDTYLMAEGTHLYVYEKLGAHLVEIDGVAGVRFAVWAPNALRVSVVGDFNNWDGRRHPMRFHHHSGVWEIFVPSLQEGELYKYEIKTRYMGYVATKSDPVGFAAELRPNTASKVWDIGRYQWNDDEWVNKRAERQAVDRPISVYELHLGSWKRKEENGEWVWLTYAELAADLIPYVKEMGFTHIE